MGSDPRPEPIKVYLDDTRPTPEGFVGCRWPEEVIDLLQSQKVACISLDHDLGETGPDARTGYDVLVWIEEQVATADFVPPEEMFVHSANPVAVRRMLAAISAIRKIHERSN